ncbi:MAG: FtsQ-type POTRA domain-containing protein [Candidatus Delongbacteria bacterium]|nr:FtsQ-type POTRA domain-containing protein [Candidatus Delongbacteria bacterium]MBN2836831.1 FtsQ-type POTRA domain-containing protein [Candidatus Delongbacteria bacterium]
MKKKKENTSKYLSKFRTILLASLKIIIGILIFSSVYEISGKIREICYESNLFIVKDITVFGTKLTSKEEIIDISGIRINCDIFSINDDYVARSIIDYGFVKNCKIEIQLPSKIVISIEEESPEAIVIDDRGNSYFVNSTSDLIGEIRNGFTTPLPIIRGNHDIAKSVKLLNILKDYDSLYTELSEIISDDRGLSIILKNSNIRIVFGKDDFDQKSEVIQNYLEKITNLNFDNISEIDVRFDNRVIKRIKKG